MAVNLRVKLFEAAGLQRAAYNTVSAVTLQGLRQADLLLAQSPAVIRLRTIERLTSVRLCAFSPRVTAFDLDAGAEATTSFSSIRKTPSPLRPIHTLSGPRRPRAGG